MAARIARSRGSLGAPSVPAREGPELPAAWAARVGGRLTVPGAGAGRLSCGLYAFLSGVIEIEARAAEQRVRCALQGADHRPDAAPLNQPPPASGLPLPAGAAHDVGELPRAAHGHQAAQLAELDRADAGRQRPGLVPIISPGIRLLGHFSGF